MKLTKPRFLLVYLLAPLIFLFAQTSENRLRLGAAFVLLGECIRLLANGYVGHMKVNWTQKWRGDRKVGQLMTGGPYTQIRHPLYFGSFFIGVGVAVIVGRPAFALAGLVLLFLVYRRKMLQEEAILLDEWPEEYARYQRAVPRYFPTWRSYPHPLSQWSWAGVMASKEWKTLIWALVCLLAFYLREEFVQEHELFGPRNLVKHAVVLFLFIALMACDGIAELVARSRRRASAGAGTAAGGGG